MKKIIIIIINIFLYISSTYSLNQTGKNLSAGYGYVAGVNSIDAVTVNPASLAMLDNNEILISFNRSFIFHSFFVGIPAIKNHMMGLAFINNDKIKHYRLGLNIINHDIFKFGFSTGPDREIGLKEDKWGVSFSPGILMVFDNRKYNFSIDIGCQYKNLISDNDFDIHKDLTEDELDFGLSSELFVENLFLNIGGNYYLDEMGYSLSLEYLFIKECNIIFLIGNDKYGIGSEFFLGEHNIGAHLIHNDKIRTYTYSLSFNAKIGKISRKKAHRRRRKQISREILNKQKKLLEKGLELYKENKYKKARSEWRKVVWMAPSTKYAEDARRYIIKVNNILKSVNE